jgi:hypothetical protein
LIMTPDSNMAGPRAANDRRHKFSKAIFISSLIAVWIIGIMVQDSWLRPWRMILVNCGAVSLTIVFIYLLPRRRQRLAAGLLFLLVMIFVNPVPSFVRSANVENQTSDAIEVRFLSMDGKRSKEHKIGSGESWKFHYHVDDNKGGLAIPSMLEVKNISSGFLVRTHVELPIPKPGPVLIISKEWFEKEMRRVAAE